MSNLQAIKQRFNIVGECPRLNEAIDIAVQVAPTDVSVLVVGENGTGKDVFSKIIHQLGKRKHKPFIAINCGAIPEGTMDSELFGHEKGSFTSAYDQRKGYFEEVNGGVIFLDEIAEMPISTQARLLRVLENGEFLRVGSSKVMKTDVRIIAATNKNLMEAIRNGKFREDLFFRLNTITITVPPLRERGKDLDLLFRYFSLEFANRYGREPVRLTDESRELLFKYHWPGNVRELRNFVEKVTVLAPNNVLTKQEMENLLPVNEISLPILLNNGHSYHSTTETNSYQSEREFLFQALFEIKNDLSELRKIVTEMRKQTNGNYTVHIEDNPTETPVIISSVPVARTNHLSVLPSIQTIEPQVEAEESLSIEKKEKDLIIKALQKSGYNRKKAAHELGISERTLYRKIKAFGLEDTV
ncbi:MAG: sigma-54 dependent transcriptional regulator [Bacteroidia bacterium]|nr:sigma-54 dependent transcriptional regulator [Bacteroidia bacterium]